MNWEQLAQNVITPFGTNKKQLALEILKQAELDFANETKCIERQGLLWTGTDVPTGSIVKNTDYMNAGYTTVVYDSVTYTVGQTFDSGDTALAYTVTGAGKVVAVTEDAWTVDLPTNYLELKQRPSWNGADMTLFDFRMNVQVRSTTEGTWVSSTPDYYWIENEQLWLYPGTNTNGRIDMSYVAYPTATDQLEASPTIPAKYHMYLIDYAKAMLYADAEKSDSYASFMGMYEKNREKIATQFYHSDEPDVTRVASIASSPTRQSLNRL